MSVERELAFGLENAGLPRTEMRELVNDACKRFAIADLRSLPPFGLSGGERQRVALAAVAILRPRCLILDEATTLLSPESRKRIIGDVLEETRSNHAALVLVTQFPEEAELADRLLIFHEGTVVMDARPDVVFSNTERLAEMGIPLPAEDRIRVCGF
jgi:energy-coupling factor transport system ATP-binding protein